jgi:hypothetical protein
VDTPISIGKAVLTNFFRFYKKTELEDAEYIPVVRVIIEGIAKGLTAAGLHKKDVKAAEKTLLMFNQALYVEEWLKHAREELGERKLDMEAETARGTYYFDYIYKHGEHPR